jgi:very-short-patch-repair endonuclease
VPDMQTAMASLGSDGERALETQLKQTGATGFVREHQFDSARRWRFDFAWPAFMVAVEVEGGQWVGGHGGKRFRQDAEKYNEAAIQGWTVLRLTTDMVDDGTGVTAVGRALWAAGQRMRTPR